MTGLEKEAEATKKRAAGATTVAVELAVPIKVNGAITSSLTVRRPTVGDYRRARELKIDESAKELWLAARLCDVSPEDFDAIDTADFEIIEAAIIGFRGQRVARAAT